MMPAPEDTQAIVARLQYDAELELPRARVPEPLADWLARIYAEAHRQHVAVVAFVDDDVVRLIDGED